MRALVLSVAILPGVLPTAGCQQSAAHLPVVATAATPDNPPPPEPTSSGPLAVTWDQLDIGIRAESIYEPWMMKTSIKTLDGQPVRITGYMHGGVAVKEG